MKQHQASVWAALVQQRQAAIGLGLLVVLVLLALLAPVLPLADPNATDLDARLFAPLTEGHLLGTDQLGRDITSRLLHGLRLSLAVAVLGTAVAAIAGSSLGLLAGYAGRRTDSLIMRGVDVLMAFPYLLLALAIVAALGPGLRNATLAIAIVNIPFFARSVRGRTLSLKRQDFISAARISGVSSARIVVSELFPHALPVIVVAMATSLGWMVLETAGLSFLGLGAQPPQADLGGMLGQARHLVAIAPHTVIIPGVMIFFLVVSLNFVADGLRSALDPKARRAPDRTENTDSPQGESQGPDEKTATSSVAGERAHPEQSAPLLRVLNLHVRFDATVAVANISFDLRAGEALGIVGESGSGKSATALALLGLHPPNAHIAGQVTYRGQELLGLGERARTRFRGRHLAFVPQDPQSSLHPLMTAQAQIVEAIRSHQNVSERSAKRTAIRLLEEVGIADAETRAHAYPHQLSGGMRQRVALAMALAHEPNVLMLDEPTTALDVTTQAQIVELLQSIRKERKLTLLFISHDLALISAMCERALVMKDGRVVEAACVRELFEAPQSDYTRHLVTKLPRLGRGSEATS